MHFAQYDAEHESGIDLAELYGVTAFPTFLVDEAGKARATHAGGELDPAWFLELLAQAEPSARTEEKVLAALRLSPLDPKTALEPGLWFVDHQRVKEALVHLDAAAKLDRGNATHVPEEAAWAASYLRRAASSRAPGSSCFGETKQ